MATQKVLHPICLLFVQFVLVIALSPEVSWRYGIQDISGLCRFLHCLDHRAVVQARAEGC